MEKTIFCCVWFISRKYWWISEDGLLVILICNFLDKVLIWFHIHSWSGITLGLNLAKNRWKAIITVLIKIKSYDERLMCIRNLYLLHLFILNEWFKSHSFGWIPLYDANFFSEFIISPKNLAETLKVTQKMQIVEIHHHNSKAHKKYQTLFPVHSSFL